ncbi:MFS transporter [Gordonia pseudamarae]|uniref:MFS transporter n=1 Tax=Gordonia pseudamarae TaxID=2831662 RepID=A0ABX6IGR3_9ACTN|nr:MULTISPECIES: MFS transporter [Gordonia]MBD0023415.1 MFS transporter [Gordonia sp. (in: high G+C Gram-positive bacteria)]QHN25552.1 MFS transporter [Gordonia pseudamarae]QHN34483.1 MFS transporter [Gordonia pseudamarae]
MSEPTTSAPDAPGRPLPRRRLGFAAAAASLVVVFAASGAPIPLYERYRSADGLTTGDLSIAAVTYFVAVMLALVVLGRLSDHIGRRAVALGAVVLAAAGSLALLDVTGLGVLMAGRALQGLACGLGSSAIAAYIVDLAPEKPRWLSATVVAGSPLIGLTIGAVGAGALAEYGPAPEQTPYIAVTVLLAVCAALLLLSPDPTARREGGLRSLRPHVHLPHTIRPLLPAAIAVFVGTWALGGFYQAFSPTISAQSLGTTNTLVAGIVFASFMAPYALGGPLAGRLSPAAAQRLGIVVFALAVVGVVIGLRTGTIAVVILCGIVAGAAQGAAFTGSMRALLSRTSAADRAGLMSTVYLFSYGGAALPSLISGRLTAAGMTLQTISLGYAGLAVLAAIVVLLASDRG